MINNDLSNLFNRLYNRSNQNEAGRSPADILKNLKSRKAASKGDTAPDAATDASQAQEAAKKSKPKTAQDILDSFTKSKSGATADKTAAAEDESNLTAEEKRQRQLAKILEKIEAEEAAKYPNRVNKEKTKETAQSDVVTTTDPAEIKDKQGLEGFLNDLPLFNEFKTNLMDAFKSMDSATSGSISAQYELNYTSMQYIANAAGGYEYKETSLNIKFDLNYVKAAAGGKSGAEIADAIGNATDFESLMNNLEEIGKGMNNQQQEQTKGIPELKNMKPEDFLTSMQDYFSPEKTAGRIVDFSTAFFPLSDAYKKGGDTPEAREEFAEMMRKAIQKGFDQAMGSLGAVPKDTQAGIDKTHDLVFKGIDDFVKNGMNKGKQDNGTYKGLQELAFSYEMNYTEKSVSVRNSNYNANGTTTGTNKTAGALDTQA